MADIFRKVYSPVSEEKKAIVAKVKDKAQELYDILIDADTVANADGRGLAIAKTELETSIMWAVKALTA